MQRAPLAAGTVAQHVGEHPQVGVGRFAAESAAASTRCAAAVASPLYQGRCTMLLSPRSFCVVTRTSYGPSAQPRASKVTPRLRSWCISETRRPPGAITS